MKKFLPLIPLLIAVAMLAPLFSMHSCANTTEAPSGGIKDTIAPYITDINPVPGTVGVPLKGAKFVFTFSEYVSIKTARNILLSPPQQKAPTTRIQGKNLVVTFEEEFKPNTCYTLSFSDAIADVNENNMFPGYTYVFSTGESIDSMIVTGSVLDCNTLMPIKGATVLLYKDLADSAVFLHRPDASAMTDIWGYFRLPYVADTTYRIYAVKEESPNNIYDPQTDLIAFSDSVFRPVMKLSEDMPEMLNYEMTDTVSCQERRSEHSLLLFREKTSKQYIKNEGRISDRAAFISFGAPNAWIDTLWVSGFPRNQIISEFNLRQDSLLLWINSRKTMPDTLHLWVNYRKTDSLGTLSPYLEHVKFFKEGKKKRNSYRERRNIKHEDTTCVFKMVTTPEKLEQDGFIIEFDSPLISASFDSIAVKSINPRQRVTKEKFSLERDSMNIRRFIIKPKLSFQLGYEYILKMPPRIFRDINGFYSDSLEVSLSLPNDDKLSSISFSMSNVDRKIIVDLLGDGDKINRSFTINSDTVLRFPYLSKGKYSLRITEDANKNSLVDTGSVLEHRQPEKVVFFLKNGKRFIDVPEGSDLLQAIDVKDLLK